MKMVWWSDGLVVRWSGSRMVAAFLAAVLGALGAAAGDDSSPGPENYLFKANVSDGGMIVFLPEAEIESREDAAAYLRWVRETYPAQASRIVAKWATEDVELTALWPAEAALLREDDSAVDFGGKIDFRVAGPAENGKIRVRLASPPAFGEANPGYCLTNIWVLQRKDLLARWLIDLNADPDGAPDRIKKQIEALRSSGRFNHERPGGDAWRLAIDDFRTNTPALWPRVRFENRSGVAVSMQCQSATNTIVPGAVLRVAVEKPPADGCIEWRARRVPAEPYLEEDYEWTTNSIAWSRTASADAVHVFAEPPGTLKPPPRLLLCVKDGTTAMPMLPGLCAVIEYKSGETNTIRVIETNGLPCVDVSPRVPMKAITLKADGYKDGRFVWSAGKEPVFGCGDYRNLPLKPLTKEGRASSPSEPQKPAPARLEVSPHQETAPKGRASSPSEPQKPATPARPEVSPRQDAVPKGRASSPGESQKPATPDRPEDSPRHDIEPWPGESVLADVRTWPWITNSNQRLRMKIWWEDYRVIEIARPGRDDYDKNNVLKRFDNLLNGKGDKWGVPFKEAYWHVATCKGCESCRVHREAMAAVPGFENQRWALFQSLLLNSGTDWEGFPYPPKKDYIQNLRKLLSEWKSRKEKGK